MIAQCRSKCCIVQLKEENSASPSPTSQRGVRGNIIIYPQKVSGVSTLLPPTLDELAAVICVVFVGAHPPTQEWLRTKAKPLLIRAQRVRAALQWLKLHNPLYKDININDRLLDSLPDEHVLPVHVEHVIPNSAMDSLTSGYVPNTPSASDAHHTVNEFKSAISFDKVIVTDVDSSASSSQLRAAALRHVQNHGAFVQIPHGLQPSNEFLNPVLFPLLYPCLFPYGIGGFENSRRSQRVSFQRHVKHLCVAAHQPESQEIQF
ncbi:hypothetical protein FB446DRAFT_764700 [Lentinula raphanica]|nr:hypothetical protein FB446DRAFT_764700 [Lentinula raphanica]